MYEALIKRLRSHNGWALNKTLDEAADAIEELEKSIPRWIPVTVTERLPIEAVFTYSKKGELGTLIYDFKNKYWEDADGYYCNTNYITHWMQLPEPPKEKEI